MDFNGVAYDVGLRYSNTNKSQLCHAVLTQDRAAEDEAMRCICTAAIPASSSR